MKKTCRNCGEKLFLKDVGGFCSRVCRQAYEKKNASASDKTIGDSLAQMNEALIKVWRLAHEIKNTARKNQNWSLLGSIEGVIIESLQSSEDRQGGIMRAVESMIDACERDESEHLPVDSVLPE